MNICIFGDSITYGGYDPTNSGWVGLLRNYLEDKFDDINTYNLGICGDDSTGLLKRFANEATPRNPDIIIIAIGANDVKHQPQTPFSPITFKNNVTELTTLAKKFTSTIVLIGITHVDESLTKPRNKPPYNYRENKDIDTCNQIIKESADQNNLIFIPIPANFGDQDLADGLHPNTTGYKKMYDAFKPVIESLITHD